LVEGFASNQQAETPAAVAGPTQQTMDMVDIEKL